MSNKNKELICEDCGRTYVYYRTKGMTITRCQSCTTSFRRHKVKKHLLNLKGGKCYLCSYSKCLSALDFHHVDEATKEFTISHNLFRKLKILEKEVQKCIVLCKNCHAEVHSGVAKLVKASV